MLQSEVRLAFWTMCCLTGQEQRLMPGDAKNHARAKTRPELDGIYDLVMLQNEE